MKNVGIAFTALLALLGLIIMPAGFTEETKSGALINVPAQYVDVLTRAGTICESISAPLLAGQIEQESGWDNTVVSPAGATGIAQFMPTTWETHGWKDSSHKPGDITNALDQIWSQGNYMCDLAAEITTLLEAQTITGNPLDLTLASYNAGLGNVTKYGGIPPFTETQNYVKNVKEKALKYVGTETSTATASGQAILTEATKYLGVPYVYGGNDPSTGLDCSGFTKLVFSKFGVNLPRTADQQANSTLGKTIPVTEMRPGDLIAFRSPGTSTWTHIGIYTGTKNGVRRMINAEWYGVPLRETSLETPYWTSQDWTIKRFHTEASTTE